MWSGGEKTLNVTTVYSKVQQEFCSKTFKADVRSVPKFGRFESLRKVLPGVSAEEGETY